MCLLHVGKVEPTVRGGEHEKLFNLTHSRSLSSNIPATCKVSSPSKACLADRILQYIYIQESAQVLECRPVITIGDDIML